MKIAGGKKSNLTIKSVSKAPEALKGEPLLPSSFSVFQFLGFFICFSFSVSLSALAVFNFCLPILVCLFHFVRDGIKS